MKKLNWLSSKKSPEVLDITAKFWKELSAKAYPLTKGSVRVPISLEPFILSRQEHESLREQILLVISAARKIVEAYFVDQDLREVFSLNDAETDLIEASKDESLVGIVRADLFYGKEPKLIELNADFPDGFFMHDVTAQSIEDVSGQEIGTSSNATLFHQLLESEGVRKEDHLFIGYNQGRKFIDEFALTKQKLEEYGWTKITYGALEELTFKDGSCYFDNKCVQVIRRGAETSKLRSNPELIAHIIESQKKSGLKLFNNFKMRLLGHKSLLAVLWDVRFARYFTNEEIVAIKTIVPETLKLSREVIQEQNILTERNTWVLKPSDLAEGEGVVIGSSCNEETWSMHIAEALKNQKAWLLQRKAEITKETFTMCNPETGEIHSSIMHYDLDPHIVLFKDKAEVGNILVRFSPSEILNVMREGGITYAFVK